jgi:hypothetical protein
MIRKTFLFLSVAALLTSCTADDNCDNVAASTLAIDVTNAFNVYSLDPTNKTKCLAAEKAMSDYIAEASNCPDLEATVGFWQDEKAKLNCQ